VFPTLNAKKRALKPLLNATRSSARAKAVGFPEGWEYTVSCRMVAGKVVGKDR
jgi:hypothetical protein